MTPDDLTLVREFAARQSEPAFAALVERHVGLVHSAALRQTGDAHLAEEITQAVFIILARKASSLGSNTILPAWLYRTTRFAASNALKIQRRRQAREQEAYIQSTLNEPDDAAVWKQIAPLLDDAMDKLSERDRAAVVLRYFENRPWGEVAAATQSTEDAAQKRVTRALEKLRGLFSKRGVMLTSTIIASAVSANSVQAAPVGFAKTISAAVLSGTAATTATIIAATKTIAMTTFQKITVTAALAATIGAGVYAAKQAHDAQNTIATLQAEQAPMQEQIQQLRNDLAVTKHSNSISLDELNGLSKSKAELMRLRRENESLTADLKKSLEQTTVALTAFSNAPPIKTFVTFASDDLKWDEAIITGGLKISSNKRVFYLASAIVGYDKDGANPMPLIVSKQLEMTEEACERLGFQKFYHEGQTTYLHDKLTAEQRAAIFSNTAQNSDGVTILAEANSLVQTGDNHQGRWGSQTSFKKIQTPAGDDYSVGSSFLLDAVLSADGNSVRLVMSSQYNKLTSPDFGGSDSTKAENH